MSGEVTRRDYLKIIGGTIVGLIIGGVVGWFSAAPTEVEKTILKTVTKTATVTPTITTVTVPTTTTVPTITTVTVPTTVTAPSPTPTPTALIDFTKNLKDRILGKDWEITRADYEALVSKVSKEEFREKLLKYPPPKQWIPPERAEEVSKHVKSFKFINAGALKDDPATEMNAAICEYLLGVKPIGVETSSTVLHPKQVTFLSAGSASPEILYLDRMFIWDYATAGWLEPIDDLWSPEVEKLYHPDIIKTIKIKGHFYASPGMCKTSMCFYRKDLFEEHGIDGPPKTWEEFVEIGKALTLDTDGDGVIDVWGWVQPFSSEDPRIQFEELWNWVYAQGGTVVDPELGYPNLLKDYFKTALQFITDLVNKYKIAPPGITTYGDKPALDVFLAGKAAMLGGWSWNWARAVKVFGEENVGVFPYPKSGGFMGTPEGRFASVLDLDAWAVNAFSKGWAKEAAKLWCDLYRSYMGQWIELCIENNDVAFLQLYKEPDVLETFPIVKVFSQMMDYAKIEAIPRCADIAHFAAPYLGAAVLGKADVESTLKKVQKYVDEVFKV